MATNYGYDTGCVTDQPRISITVTNPNLVIGQRIARCWQTVRGALAAIGGDPNWGESITQYLNAKLSPSFIKGAENALLVAALRDPEVQSGTVDMTFNSKTGDMTVDGRFTSAAGPFSVVANVDALTTAVIFTFNP